MQESPDSTWRGPSLTRSARYCIAAPITRKIDNDTGASTVIVGLGNEIAGDDGVGIHAAQLLRRELRDRHDVEVVELPWAGLHLLTALRGFQTAILIDSLQSHRHAPGTVVRLSEDDLAGSIRLNSFHDLNYPTALTFGRALGWPMPSHIEIYAVEGELFDRFTSRLTPTVEAGLREVVRLVTSSLSIPCETDPCAEVEVPHAHCSQP